MGHNRKHIKALSIKDHSGFFPKPGAIEFVKRHNYFIEKDVSITGDAPKDFIRKYSFGSTMKNNPDTWLLYIAKLGHKHYPMESITEYLLNRIGEEFGFNIAHSRLAWLGGQIRFLSEYFIEKPDEQVLEHGADLYAGYLNDKAFVEEIEAKKQSPDFFTVQFTEETLMHFFYDDSESLMQDFLKLLVFDALIGNNDRHFYNWGIIRNILDYEKPKFSPIYDTARGLFWNDHEDKLQRILNNEKNIDNYITNYCESSTPKIGWDNCQKVNHFDLISKIKAHRSSFDCNNFLDLCNEDNLYKTFKMIDLEFSDLMSEERIFLIKKCLQYRFDRLYHIIY
jgi:hypothetical protein